MMGHERLGVGPNPVVVLNDWICDTSTWDAARAYLDCVRFTWAFADLRGYGRSRGRVGKFALDEAADDVFALADGLGWPRFTIVGHSMSSLVALHLAQHWPDRIDQAIVLTPPPPTGFGADGPRLDYLRTIGRGDDAARLTWLRSRLGDRLSEGWLRFKLERWRASADPDAVAGYVAMFAQHGLPQPTARIGGRLLAVTGERDLEVMRQKGVTKLLTPICERLTVAALADCGHYPMQELPPLLVTIIERFLTDAQPA